MDDKLYQIAQDVAEVRADVKHLVAAVHEEREERERRFVEMEAKLDEQNARTLQLQDDHRLAKWAGRLAVSAFVITASAIWWLAVHVPAEAWVLIAKGVGA